MSNNTTTIENTVDQINQKASTERNSKFNKDTLKCGIIMPIAAMGEYTADHWQEVKSIIIESTQQIDGLKFKTEIVSDSEGEINIIHKNIIQNIYNSDIVICDISGKNPNVLFELGMRLTFDKPTILIKDDVTDYMFDTGSIEHLTYPKDLRFGKIVQFKDLLALRIKQTYQTAMTDNTYSPFLGAFGEFKVPSLTQTTVSDVQQLILDEIIYLKKDVNNFKKSLNSDKIINAEYEQSVIEIIGNFITQNGILHYEPEKIILRNDFIDYLHSNNINHLSFSKRKLLSLIREASNQALPF